MAHRTRFPRPILLLSMAMATALVAIVPAAHAGMPPAAAPSAAADLVYLNGRIHTIDAGDSVQQALAVRAGRIVYVGSNDGAASWTGKASTVVDLHGRMLMPGLIDAHMHPQSGGSRLLNCSLDYAALTVAQLQARVQACADADVNKFGGEDPQRWLVVVNWFQQGTTPEGAASSSAMLDAVRTVRPIIVRSSFGHSALLNGRGVAVAGIAADTADPPAGKIVRDSSGAATGMLEDAAQDLAMSKLPPLSVAENLAASKAALDAMRRQGITGFVDAWTDPETMTAFATIERGHGLSARAWFAVLIDLDKGATPASAVADLLKQKKQFDQGALRPAPSMQVRQAKLFMDGVIAAPAFTGAMLAPYLVNRGSAAAPDWQPGPSNGPPTYFSRAALRRTLAALAAAGIDPHIHVDGDRAVREALDAIAVLRTGAAGKRSRPMLAHDEIVDPADFGRFGRLGVTAVLSFQWAKPAPDTVDALREYLGPARYALVEPQALLLQAGARVAYGSDWPVDPLDIWFALKVGVTRTAPPDGGAGTGSLAQAKYSGRLTSQPGMPRAAVLRAATIDAAYTVRAERQTGSLEVGKFADLIVLDRDFFSIPAEQIADIKVLQTVVGGRVVYEADGWR